MRLSALKCVQTLTNLTITTMRNTIVSIIVSAIVALVVGFVVVASHAPTPVSTQPVGTGQTNTNIDAYTNGVQIGDVTEFNKYLDMNAGANTVAWKNNTGRVVNINSADARTLQATSTTNAYTSYSLYMGTSSVAQAIATSSTAGRQDFVRPNMTYALIDGGFIATSTKQLTIAATSTTNGYNRSISVQPGEYLVGEMLQTYGCRVDVTGTCLTATSTARGFNLRWSFQARYKQ